MVYKLKTTSQGAIVREWPAGFSVWVEDAGEAEGYRHLQSFAIDPPYEAIDQLYDVSMP